MNTLIITDLNGGDLCLQVIDQTASQHILNLPEMSKEEFENYLEWYLWPPNEDPQAAKDITHHPDIPLGEGYPHILQEAYTQSPVPESIDLSGVTKVIYIYPYA